MTHRRLVVAGTVASLVAVGSVAALAQWSRTALGSGASKASHATAPGTPLSNGTNTATQIPIKWVAGSAGSATVKYWVERADFGGSTWSNACGSTEAAPITGTNCTDTGLTQTHDYQYRVTVIDGKWEKTSGTSGKLTTATPVSHSFTVSAATSTPTAGTSFTVTITAKNNSSIDTTYAGTKTLDWSGGQTIGANSPTYPANPVTFTAGVATVSVTLVKAGAQTITVSDHNDATYTGNTGALTVSAAIVQLTLSCPASAAKGSQISATLGRPTSDSFGNSTTGSSVTVSVSATVAAPSSQNVVIAANSASHDFNVTLSNANNTSTVLTTNAPTGYTSANSCSTTHT